jgi:hypothetical protein
MANKKSIAPTEPKREYPYLVRRAQWLAQRMETMDPLRSGFQYDEHEYEELIDVLGRVGVALPEHPPVEAPKDPLDTPPMIPTATTKTEWVPGQTAKPRGLYPRAKRYMPAE